MTRLHKEELEKANSQNVEQRHEHEFCQWFKIQVSRNLYIIIIIIIIIFYIFLTGYSTIKRRWKRKYK